MQTYEVGTEEQAALAVLATVIATTERDLVALVRAKEEYGSNQESGRVPCGWSVFGRPIDLTGTGRRLRRPAAGDHGTAEVFAAD